MANLLDAGRRLLTSLNPFSSVEANARRAPIVEETPPASGEGSSSDETDEAVSATVNPKFCFKVETLDREKEMRAIAGHETERGRDAYLFSVLNWSVSGYVGRRKMDHIQDASASQSATYISIGSYCVEGVIEMIQHAADASGFTLYAHKGAVFHGNRCSIRFGCDHGRKRTVKELADRQTPVFEKDLTAVVQQNCRKKRTTRANHGYDSAETARRRLKRTECDFHFTIIAYQRAVTFDPNAATNWQLSSHGNSTKNFHHVRHTLRGTRIILTEEAKKYILATCARVTVPELLANIHYAYNLDLTVSQVRYFISKNNDTVCTVPTPQGRSRAGDALPAILQLLRTNNSQVILLLVDVLTGELLPCLRLRCCNSKNPVTTPKAKNRR